MINNLDVQSFLIGYVMGVVLSTILFVLFVY